MKKSFNLYKNVALLALVCLLISSCTSDNGTASSKAAGTTPEESSAVITEEVTESIEAAETADPEEVRKATEAYESYVSEGSHALPDGFIPYTSLWFEYLGDLTAFEMPSKSAYHYTFTDEFGFGVKATVVPVDVDDIDVYRTFIVPYEDGRSAEEGQLSVSTPMNGRKGYAGKTVTLDRTHYIYNDNGDLISVSTVYEGNYVEYTPADYEEKGVTFSDYENSYGFVSNFIDGWNAARVFTAGIYPQNSVYASTADQFIDEADRENLRFTDSVKASDIIKLESFIPDGYVIDSVDFYDLLDYERYSQEKRVYNILLKSTKDENRSISYNISYVKFGLGNDAFDTSKCTMIDEEREIFSDIANNCQRLYRSAADSVDILMRVDADNFTEDIKNTFAVFSDEVLSMVASDLPADGVLPQKVTFSSFYELESLASVVEKSPESIEAYLERRGYALRGLDTADEAAALMDMMDNVPTFGVDGKYNLAYYPLKNELSVNYYVRSADDKNEYSHIQFRYMPAEDITFTSLVKDTNMPPMNLGSISIDTCAYSEGLSYLGKWTNGTYGLIVSEACTEGFDGTFFTSVYERIN